jgi:hypothetical protein
LSDIFVFDGVDSPLKQVSKGYAPVRERSILSDEVLNFVEEVLVDAERDPFV